jgi:hypothetical protein
VGGRLATIRDVSACGIYFETTGAFDRGEHTTLVFCLRHAIPNDPVLVRCEGDVVRVVPRGPRVGVAITNLSYSVEALPNA